MFVPGVDILEGDNTISLGGATYSDLPAFDAARAADPNG
jgi:hypothetical protein